MIEAVCSTLWKGMGYNEISIRNSNACHGRLGYGRVREKGRQRG